MPPNIFTKSYFFIFLLSIFLLGITKTSSLSCDFNICSCLNSTCISCLDNSFYYDSTIKTCNICPPECLTCQSTQQCITCRQMFYLSSLTNQCLQCPKYCKVCSSSNSSTLSNITASTNATCIQCINGYVLISSVCQKCQIPNVQTCQSLMTVKACLSGFWKNGDSCSSCRQFCQFCTSGNNCLRCSDGYRIKISAGTYCVACELGCKTCSETSCTQCFFNYRLTNGRCQSIQANCSMISACTSCQYSSSTNSVKCLLCQYPYYLNSNTSTCQKGSSLLCKYSNSLSNYQCLSECSDYGYNVKSIASTSNKNINQVICLPRLWIESSGIEQIYFNSLYAKNRYLQIFSPTVATNGSSSTFCGVDYIISNYYSTDLMNNMNFTYTFPPYYRLVLFIKYYPIFKSYISNNLTAGWNDSNTNLFFTSKMSDNASNLYTYQQNFSSSDDYQTCRQEYMTIVSKNIKDQSVKIEFYAQLVGSNSNYSHSQFLAAFPNGLIGYRQILIQIYRCDSKCRICSNTKYCLECYLPLFLSYTNHVCIQSCQGLFQYYLPEGNYINFTSKYCISQCLEGYYNTIHPLKNGTYICLKCPPKCKTCKSQFQCLSCVQPWLFFATNFSCIEICPLTHYQNNASGQCVPCNAPCKTCKNQNQCLTCMVGFFDGKNCVGICPIGTYSSSQMKQCLSCDSKCTVCQNTPTFCSACQTDFKLLGSTCLSSCPINTHYQYNGICLSCKSPCNLCNSETSCISCSRGYLFNQSCLSECPIGYYKDIGNSRCNLCQNNCKTCLSPSVCRTCINGTYLYNSMCLTECPMKTYINSNGVCIPCIPPCLTCNSQSLCLTCLIGYLSLIQNNTCLNQCEPGYFGYSSNQTCLKCSPQCKTCKQQASFCLTCQNGLLLQNNKCVSNCSLNYFSFNYQKCRPCSYPCLTCVDLSTKCLTCQPPFILLSQNKCSLQCLSTQYKKNGSCLNCVSPCLSCTQINVCTSCIRSSSNQTQTYLIYGTCLQYCPDGMYKDALSLKCKDCVFPCLSCLSSRQCLSCVSGFLNVGKKTCEVCSSSYYADNTTRTCKLCSTVLANCQQCQSQIICKVCFGGYFLFNNTCVSQSVCSLKSGYFVNYQTKKCAQCIPPCKDCHNTSFCKTCMNGFYFAGKCLFSCPGAYYSDITTKSCLQCNYSICKACINSLNQCTECFFNSTLNVLFLQNKTCIKQQNCGHNYYIDKTYGYSRCLKCVSPCKTCQNSSYCTSCLAGVLYKGSCSFSCPNKFYAQQENISFPIISNTTTSFTSSIAVCQQCSTNCLQCSLNYNNCISCPITKFLQHGLCVDKCSATFYLNQYIFQCIKCQSPCLQCDSATYCLSCLNSTKILYYGQCIDQCPQGTYINLGACISCPSQCQLCQYSINKSQVVCKKCSSGLYMNSTSQGACQSICKSAQYPDNQTRRCYPCQIPCLECYTAIKCKSCINDYLLYQNNQCLKGTSCLLGTFLDPFSKKCLLNCYQPYYGDYSTIQCNQTCSDKNLKVIIGQKRICQQSCPSNYFVDSNFTCTKCYGSVCSDILSYEIYAKSIFNKLFLKIKFSKQVLTALITNNSMTVLVTEIEDQRNSAVLNRRLQSLDSSSSSAEIYSYQITQRTSRALWLKINTYKTLKKVSIKVHFDSYYLLSPTSTLSPSPATNFQILNTSILVERFDQYTLEQKQQGRSFQKFSIFLSILLIIIIIIGIATNCLSLFYKLIDYYQILFMLQFLSIDYPPILNYFLYGFRWSHYLFLPQIFSSTTKRQEYSQTPGKFGIIVPDADFLNNTGHDFLIIFICIGIVVIAKIIDFLLSGNIKNNKVSNDPQEQVEDKNNNKDFGKQITKNNVIQSSNPVISQQNNVKQNQANNLPNSFQLKTHNKIELQILQGKHGKIAKYTKIFISRLKWNYFNDISYCLYFYIALFSYSQTYIVTYTKFISNLFAFFGLAFTLALPIFFIYLIYKNRQVIELYALQKKTHLPFKTFYYFMVPDTPYTLYTIPIRYIQKLIIAILLVFCSQFPEFVLGIILMVSLLNIVLMYLYKPFLLTIQLYVQMVIEGMFLIIIFCLCLMELDYLSLETQNKLSIAKGVVGITVVLALGLIAWNGIRLIVQLIKQFGGKDYFENYYRQINQDQFSQLKSQLQKRKSQLSISQALQKHSKSPSGNNNNDIHQQSNVRLNPGQGFLSPKLNQLSQYGYNYPKNNRNSQDQQYSVLDIYLKKQSDAPPMLIKCIKNFDNEQQQLNDDEKESSQNQKPSSSQSQYSSNNYQRGSKRQKQQQSYKQQSYYSSDSNVSNGVKKNNNRNTQEINNEKVQKIAKKKTQKKRQSKQNQENEQKYMKSQSHYQNSQQNDQQNLQVCSNPQQIRQQRQIDNRGINDEDKLQIKILDGGDRDGNAKAGIKNIIFKHKNKESEKQQDQDSQQQDWQQKNIERRLQPHEQRPMQFQTSAEDNKNKRPGNAKKMKTIIQVADFVYSQNQNQDDNDEKNQNNKNRYDLESDQDKYRSQQSQQKSQSLQIRQKSIKTPSIPADMPIQTNNNTITKTIYISQMEEKQQQQRHKQKSVEQESQQQYD